MTTTVAEISLWGTTVGAVSLEGNASIATFQYTPQFTKSGFEISPIMMPLNQRVYSFPTLSQATFHGLPGLLADSLPDKFGNALIDAWLTSQGRIPASFNAVERLCYTGARGMGALEYAPTIGSLFRASRRIEIDALVALASATLNDKNKLQSSFSNLENKTAMQDILRVGTSAGGARAKAVIAWNRATNEVRSGQVKADSGFEYWLIKFDGVANNKDKELADPLGFGELEYAYALMAKAAGITMSECRLLEENGRCHFMTRRFDRDNAGGKLHMQTLGALNHFDFNQAGAYSYEQAFLTMRQLRLPPSVLLQQFKRMVFNIVARNQDDHVKNIAFLLGKDGQWQLSPAYDITYSYNPQGAWTAQHQMSVNGKRDGFTLDDLHTCARVASIKRPAADAVIADVRTALKGWIGYAEQAGVSSAWSAEIERKFRVI